MRKRRVRSATYPYPDHNHLLSPPHPLRRDRVLHVPNLHWKDEECDQHEDHSSMRPCLMHQTRQGRHF